MNRSWQWTYAMWVFLGLGVLGLVVAGLGLREVVNFEEATFTDAFLKTLGAICFVALAGVEVQMLRINHDAGFRLGLTICLVCFVTFGVAGFILQSYLAIAFLMLPVYLAYLVWTGRGRWQGFKEEDAAL